MDISFGMLNQINMKKDVSVKMMMKIFLEIPGKEEEEDLLANFLIVLTKWMMDFHHRLEFHMKSGKGAIKD